MSGQVEEANAVFQLVTQVSKIGLSYLCKISCFVPQEPTLFRPHDKSLTCIYHAACLLILVKMAGYLSRSFFVTLLAYRLGP